jgi:hypothetical protein
VAETRNQAELRVLELAARSSIEGRYGRALSDQEWAATKRALLDLAKLLRDWGAEKAHADRAA